jgi:hypothetical protein
VRAERDFLELPASFWALIKLVSQDLGYSERGTGRLKIYTEEDVVKALERRDLSPHDVADEIRTVVAYVERRAAILYDEVRPNLMSREEAAAVFEELRSSLSPTCPLPMNKQRGAKRHHAYLTGIVNMLTEAGLGSSTAFNADPRGPLTFTRDGRPIRTMSRRLDGAYPAITNPLAAWEVKEYYGTTTFGSRVAGGVYETILDGTELLELLEMEGIAVAHYLIVDDHFTWWKCGRSYLCRIIDMLHSRLVDEVLFGRETLSRWPEIVKSWPRP